MRRTGSCSGAGRNVGPPPLTVYAVCKAKTGGPTLFTIKWTGFEPTEAGWSPPSDTTHWVPTHQSVSQRAFDIYYPHFICARPALGIASGPLARTMTGRKMDRPASGRRHHPS